MHKNKRAKALIVLGIFSIIILIDYIIHSILSGNSSNYKRLGNLYVRTNNYGMYIRYPGSLNFYNIYPSGVYEIDSNYRKIQRVLPTKVVASNNFNAATGIETLLSYFNLLNPKRDGIKFKEEKGTGTFEFEDIIGKDNILVSLEYNETDLIVDKDLQVLGKVEYEIQDLKRYFKTNYNLDIKASATVLEKGTIFDKDVIYIVNPEDTIIIGIKNIPNKQVIRRIDIEEHLLEVDLLGGNTLEIYTVESLKDIQK